MKAHDCNFHDVLRRCINDRCPLHRALRLLAANLATAAGLAEAFELGNLHARDVYWHGGKHAWRPGCGRPAQGWGK